jgi:hypothetical protein
LDGARLGTIGLGMSRAGCKQQNQRYRR